MRLSLVRVYEGEDTRQLSMSAVRNTISITYFTHVEGPEWEFCIFDVMATGDYGMAATIYGSN